MCEREKKEEKKGTAEYEESERERGGERQREEEIQREGWRLYNHALELSDRTHGDHV